MKSTLTVLALVMTLAGMTACSSAPKQDVADAEMDQQIEAMADVNDVEDTTSELPPIQDTITDDSVLGSSSSGLGH